METQGLKQLLLQSAACDSTKEDSIENIIDKEKQRKDISDQKTKVLNEIDQINIQIKSSTKESASLSKQLADIKTDIRELQKVRLDNQHYLVNHKIQLTILQQASKEQRNEIQELERKTETHELKLAPTSSHIPTSPWQFHSDTNTYPILKSMSNKDSISQSLEHY